MMRAYRFYMITIGLMIMAFMMMTLSVNATQSKRLQHENEYYEELEDSYVKELREELADRGFRNAGITMTKIFYEDGSREYTVKIHHKRMERLTKQEQDNLLADLTDVSFDDSECRVYLKFL